MFPISSFRTFCHKFSMQKRNISSFLQELKINWIIISIVMAEFWSWKELRLLTFTDAIYFASSIMEDRTSMLISQYYLKVHKSRAHLEPGQASRVGVGQTFMALVFAKAVNWLACEICGECIKLALHWFFRHSIAGVNSTRLDNLIATNSSLHATYTSSFKYTQVLFKF